ARRHAGTGRHDADGARALRPHVGRVRAPSPARPPRAAHRVRRPRSPVQRAPAGSRPEAHRASRGHGRPAASGHAAARGAALFRRLPARCAVIGPVQSWRRHWFEPAPLFDLAMARLVVVAIVAWLTPGARAILAAAAAPQFWKPIPFLFAV